LKTRAPCRPTSPMGAAGARRDAGGGRSARTSPQTRPRGGRPPARCRVRTRNSRTRPTIPTAADPDGRWRRDREPTPCLQPGCQARTPRPRARSRTAHPRAPMHPAHRGAPLEPSGHGATLCPPVGHPTNPRG
jgi:hypothetical protein